MVALAEVTVGLLDVDDDGWIEHPGAGSGQPRPDLLHVGDNVRVSDPSPPTTASRRPWPPAWSASGSCPWRSCVRADRRAGEHRVPPRPDHARDRCRRSSSSGRAAGCAPVVRRPARRRRLLRAPRARCRGQDGRWSDVREALAEKPHEVPCVVLRPPRRHDHQHPESMLAVDREVFAADVRDRLKRSRTPDILKARLLDRPHPWIRLSDWQAPPGAL